MSAPDNWQIGDGYEMYIGRWSRKVAPLFLSWMGVAPGKRWLDVGCGTGALSAAILENCSPESVIGIDPSEGFLATARQSLGTRVELKNATADAIPLADQSVDAVASGLMLNFVPQPAVALA